MSTLYTNFAMQVLKSLINPIHHKTNLGVAVDKQFVIVLCMSMDNNIMHRMLNWKPDREICNYCKMKLLNAGFHTVVNKLVLI